MFWRLSFGINVVMEVLIERRALLRRAEEYSIFDFFELRSC